MTDLERVKQNGLALQFVKEQTPEICLAAVRRDAIALEYVKEQTPEICTEAVKQNANAVIYITNPMILNELRKKHPEFLIALLLRS